MNTENRTVRERVEAVFADQFGEAALIKFRDDDEPFQSLKNAQGNPGAETLLDSLDHVEFVMALEDEFHVIVPDAIAEKCETIDHAVEEVEKLLAAKR